MLRILEENSMDLGKLERNAMVPDTTLYELPPPPSYNSYMNHPPEYQLGEATPEIAMTH
jgi:hypothetical protein